MALSSTKAECMALSEATQEAVWLKVFMCEIGEIAKEKAVKIYDDNQGSIALSTKTKVPQAQQAQQAHRHPLTPCA